jgi:hypothetical protein
MAKAKSKSRSPTLVNSQQHYVTFCSCLAPDVNAGHSPGAELQHTAAWAIVPAPFGQKSSSTEPRVSTTLKSPNVKRCYFKAIQSRLQRPKQPSNYLNDRVHSIATVRLVIVCSGNREEVSTQIFSQNLLSIKSPTAIHLSFYYKLQISFTKDAKTPF